MAPSTRSRPPVDLSPMAEVAAGELHENTDEVLRRVRAGEEITITVEGEPVAQVVPLPPRKKGLTFEELFRRLEKIPYDPEFAREMELASGEYSDEDPLPWDR